MNILCASCISNQFGNSINVQSKLNGNIVQSSSGQRSKNVIRACNHTYYQICQVFKIIRILSPVIQQIGDIIIRPVFFGFAGSKGQQKCPFIGGIDIFYLFNQSFYQILCNFAVTLCDITGHPKN